MHTPVRRAAFASLVASVLALGVAVPVASVAAAAPGSRALRPHTAPAAVSVAAAAAGWIARDLSANGALIDANSKKASVPDTSNAILALVAARQGANQVKSAVNWLKHNYASYVSSNGVDDPGALALVTLAAVAAGANPHQFGGTTSADDLVARLTATEQTTGAFGTGPDSNAFYQSLALLALAAVKNTSKATRLGESYLASLQCTDGGWEYGRTAITAACATPSPKDYSSPDTNTTALAVMAIVATGGHFAHNPVSFFAASQETDASFGFYGVSGKAQKGDPDSTAYSIQALIALHAIGDKAFVRKGTTVEQALAGFQLGCKTPVSERGEFEYFGAPNQLATLQAVPGAAAVAFPLTARKLSVAEPRLSCSAS